MGIAYSGSNVVYTTIRCDTSAHFRSDLDSAFNLSGISTKSVLSNGFKYTLTSPQSLKCKLRVQDTGSTVSSGGNTYNTVEFQIMSLDETLQGINHQIIYGAAAYINKGYEVITSVCQFFLALAGVADETDLGGFGFSRNYSVAAGIPFVVTPTPGTECAASSGPTSVPSQIFWLSGNGVADIDLRTGWFPTGSYTYCYNGVLVNLGTGLSNTSSPYNDQGTIKIHPLTPTEAITSAYYSGDQTKIVKYGNHNPLFVDAILGWNWSLQGQLYDAFQATTDQTLDSILSLTQTDVSGNPVTSNWVAWNHYLPGDTGLNGTYYHTLYLLTGKPGVAGKAANYAY